MNFLGFVPCCFRFRRSSFSWLSFRFRRLFCCLVVVFFRRRWLMMERRLPRGRTVIRRIKTGAFEHDPYRCINFVKRLLSALWTFCKRVISKMLENIKLVTAPFTSISISRHISLLYSKMQNRPSFGTKSGIVISGRCPETNISLIIPLFLRSGA